MTNKPPPPEAIRRALALDGDPDTIKKHYAKWSKTHDEDVGGDHVSPYHMVRALVDWMAANRPDTDIAACSVMDVGCGTGFVGRELANVGFSTIDGIDLSAEMIEKARQLGVYRQLTADIDINLNAHGQWNGQYDIVTCCGVFTLGHVQPESLINMLRFARSGGLVITTTRNAYYESTNYQQVSDQVVDEGWVKLRQHIENAPYTNDSDAHYWLYELN